MKGARGGGGGGPKGGDVITVRPSSGVLARMFASSLLFFFFFTPQSCMEQNLSREKGLHDKALIISEKENTQNLAAEELIRHSKTASLRRSPAPTKGPGLLRFASSSCLRLLHCSSQFTSRFALI